MAKKKSRVTKTHEMIDTKTEDLMPMAPESPKIPKLTVKIALVVLVLGLIALFTSNKGLLVAAMVNGKPIFRWELNGVLLSNFGKQTLDSMISERIIYEEAQKSGVSVTKSDIDIKVASVVASLGEGSTLEQLLQYSGMTREDFEGKLKLQMTVEKLLGKDIVITESDINNYIATASAMLTATDEAGMREEARQAILSQKINEKFQAWFTQLREKASILRFL